MKQRLLLLLTLGFVTAGTISKQIVSVNENHMHHSENIESEAKYDANLNLNKEEAEQKNQANIDSIIGGKTGNDENMEVIFEETKDLPQDLVNIESIIGGKTKSDGNMEVIFEETVDLPQYLLPRAIESEDTVLYDNSLPLADPNKVIERHPEEIMETAAGLVPVPIIRWRQKPKRRFASRRNYKRKPNRRVYYYYPFYPYYYQSSLGYY